MYTATFLVALIGIISLIKANPSREHFELILQLLFEDGGLIYIYRKRTPIFPSQTHPVILYNVHSETYLTYDEVSGYVIYAEDCEELKYITKELLRSNFFISKRKRMLVVLNDSSQKCAFDVIWSNDIYDVFVLNERMELFHDGLTNNCGKESHPQLMNNDFVKLPKVFENFRNCSLKVMYDVSFRKMPYCGDPRTNMPGLYIQPLIEIAKKLNFTLIFVPEPDDSAYEYVDNLTTHVTERILYEKEQDVLIALTNRLMHYYQRFEMSTIIYQEPQIWLIPKPKRISDFRIIFRTFTLIEWTIIIVTFLSVSIVWCVISKTVHSKDLIKNFLLLLAITFNSSLHVTLKSQSLNTLFIFYIFYCFYINFYFQGHLSSLFVKPLYEDPIKNEQQLANSNLIPIINRHKIIYMENLNDTIAKKLAAKSRTPFGAKMPEDVVSFVYKNRNVVTTSFPSAIKLVDNYDSKIDYIETRIVMGMEATYVYRKGYPLIPIIDKKIVALQEGGFFIKWLDDLRKRKSNKQNYDDGSALELSHLIGIFTILLSGLCAASVVFLIEILLYYRIV